MSAALLLNFEDEAPRGTGETGATLKIARALDACGIDAPTSLYDEALALAQEGRLAPASERLRMLLCLDPNDGEAALLLGKVLAAREQWQEALSWLDAAAANGSILPPGLRDSVEEGTRRMVQDAEEARNRITSRERGEIRNLRNEAKRLRSEGIALEAENETLRARVRTWSGITAVVAGSASALLLAAMLFGTPGVDAASDEPVGSNAATADLAELGPEGASAAPVAPAAGTPAAGTPAAAPAAAPSAAAVAASGATMTVPVAQPFAASAQPDITGAAPVKATVPTVEAPAQKAAPKAEAKTSAKSVGPIIATHQVKKGENLGSIARKYYGDSSAWPAIQSANAELLGSGNALQVGMKLKIPKNK